MTTTNPVGGRVDQNRPVARCDQRRRLIAAAVAVVGGSLAISFPADAVTFTYTPTNATTDLWSAGTNWDTTPASNVATRLTLIANNATVVSDGLTNVNTDDVSGLFQLNILDLQGTGPAGAGAPATISINATAPSTGLNFISNGATTPVVNLNALAGASSLTYNLNAPITFSNTTTFTGSGTAVFKL